MRRAIAAFALCAFTSTGALAYEQATHALLTHFAFTSSAFSLSHSAGLTQQLGLHTYRPMGSGSTYAEFAGGSILLHEKQLFESKIVSDLSDVLGATEEADLWMIYGAIREDDNPAEDPATPQDIAPGLKRPLHHFYDPYHDLPLNMTHLDLVDSDIHKNPDWAIGSRDSFTNPNAEETSRRNTFTIMDAREAMFRALTLMRPVSGTYASVATGDPQSDEKWRQAYWTTTFRALGDVLHLNQDMAQPQHTRNEAHSGKYCFSSSALLCPAGHTSVYEKYINTRVLSSSSFNSLAPHHTYVKVNSTPISTAGYFAPNFGKYTDYWATKPAHPFEGGKGLAEFSNRGFFTAANNFDSEQFWLPSRNLNDYVVWKQPPVRWDGTAGTNMAPVKVYYGTVTDTLEPRDYSGVALTTFGVWDEFLQKRSFLPKYSLNRLNYDAMAELLLPRAVAYSAGLINFFFRGRLDIALPQEGVFAVADHGSSEGFKMLRVRVRNSTGSFVDPDGADQPQHMRGGTFFAVIRYHKDKKYTDSLDTVVGTAPCNDYSQVVDPANSGGSTECRDGVEQIVVSEPVTGESLDVNAEKTLKFDFAASPIPFAMTDVLIQVVYRGPLGSETDAVAVGTIDASEPTYFTYHNASDYIHLGGHVYTRAEVDSDPALLSLVQPQYCVDYQQVPARLDPFCFRPFTIDMDLGFEDASDPLVHVDGLPSRRFLRIAYLSTADDPAASASKKTMKARLAAHAARRQRDREMGSEKQLLNQRGYCLPLDPFDIPPRHSQMTVISATEITYRVSPFKTLRGVNGYFNTSCVTNGDQADPGATDDRNEKMSTLDRQGEEWLPFGVTIAAEYQPASQP